MWRCACECGREAVVEGRLLRDGTTSSCGCLVGKSNITHGHSYGLTYSSWRAMLKRCGNPKHPAYRRYAGRGVGVCERWRKSFAAFLEDMGERPSRRHTIDRIDNGGGYEPGNCRWADWHTQQRNRRDNVPITFDGRTQLLTEWAEEIGLTPTALYRRLKKDWPLEVVLTRPPMKGVPYRPQGS